MTQYNQRLVIPNKQTPHDPQNLEVVERWANSQVVNKIVPGAGVTITEQTQTLGSGNKGTGVVTISASGGGGPGFGSLTDPYIFTGVSYETSLNNEITDVIASSNAHGEMAAALIWLPAGKTISNLYFLADQVWDSNITHLWMGITDYATRTLAATTADQGATVIPANQLVGPLALTAPYTVPTTGLYYFWLNHYHTSGATWAYFIANGIGGALNTIPPILGGVTTSLATGPPSLGTVFTITNADHYQRWMGAS